jgi:nucleoside-diphosphate-sugar epimerase
MFELFTSPTALGLMGAAFVLWCALMAFLLTPPKPVMIRKPSADPDPDSRPGLAKMVMTNAPKTGKRYVVIGTGNVGMTLVDALIERGETVVGFDIAPPRRTPRANFTFVKGNVSKYDDVRGALEGADVVFATFAVIRYHERLPHDYAASHAVNVQGTENVIRACVEQDVGMLVQTSTSHVVMSAAQYDKHGIDERAPYVTKSTAENHYSWTKAQAEQLVLAANGKALRSGGTLATAAVRPCSGIFGPQDGLIAEATLKKLHTTGAEAVVCLGAMDWLYVEDLVYAELLCERKLADDPKSVGARSTESGEGGRGARVRARERESPCGFEMEELREWRSTPGARCRMLNDTHPSPLPCAHPLSRRGVLREQRRVCAWLRLQHLPLHLLQQAHQAQDGPVDRAQAPALRACERGRDVPQAHAQEGGGPALAAHAVHARLRLRHLLVQRRKGQEGPRLQALVHAGRGHVPDRPAVSRHVH